MIDAEREALIEKMARAIACHDAPNPKDCLASEWCEENWICYVPEATAAFAVAEAADCIDTIRTENEKLRAAKAELLRLFDEAMDGYADCMPYKGYYLIGKHGDKENFDDLRAAAAAYKETEE